MEQLIPRLEEAKYLIGELAQGNVHPVPPRPSIIVEKDTEWVNKCLKPFNVRRLPLDRPYWLTDKESFIEIVAWDWVDSHQYIPHKYDCENFAIEFFVHVTKYFGLSQVGIVIDYASRHGYNVVLFPNGEVNLLEPQNDSLFITEDRNILAYNFRNAYVLL